MRRALQRQGKAEKTREAYARGLRRTAFLRALPRRPDG
jgi:hypothetical protein